MHCKHLARAGLLGCTLVAAAGPTYGSPDEGVSLTKILAHARGHSPLLKVAHAQALQGEAELQAAAPLLPRDPQLSTSVGPRFGSGGSGLDVQLSLSQQFWIAGQRGLRRTAAERLRDRTEAQLAQTHWLVHWRVHALFHQAIVAREGATAAGQLLVFAESVLSIAKGRHKAGDISPLQVRVAEVEAAQARQAKVAADNAFLSARLNLAEAAGWSAASPPRPAGGLGKPRRAPDPQRLLELAIKSAPRLRTGKAAALETAARRRLAEREVWPDPTVGVSYVRESDPATGGTDASIALLTVGVPIPVWQRNRGARARALADHHLAVARVERVRSTLRVRVARAAASVTAGADRVAAYGEQILPALERNLELLRRSLELGEIDLLNVVVAQQRFVRIQRDALSAFADYYRAVAQLESVVGAQIWPDDSHEEGVP